MANSTAAEVELQGLVVSDGNLWRITGCMNCRSYVFSGSNWLPETMCHASWMAVWHEIDGFSLAQTVTYWHPVLQDQELWADSRSLGQAFPTNRDCLDPF